MRPLPLVLSLMLALFPGLQAYGKTMADTHCRASGHVSATAADAARDSVHAQHHAPDAGAQVTTGADAQADDAHCQCGCLCNAACGGAAVLSAFSGAASDVPAHEPWQAVTDIRHPVSVHDSLLRPPRLS